MSDLNCVHLVGNLVKDPEIKDIGGGKKVTNFVIASNRKWTGPEGQKVEDVSFIDCVAFDGRAEAIHTHLFKGRKILVEGRLKQEKWTDKETKKAQSRIKIIVESFHFMDNKKRICETAVEVGIPAEAGNDDSSDLTDNFDVI